MKMVLLYSNKIYELSLNNSDDEVSTSLTYLKAREKKLLLLLSKKYPGTFTPIALSKDLNVTNKTVINRLSALAKAGFISPILVRERIRSYVLTDYAKKHEKQIRKLAK